MRWLICLASCLTLFLFVPGCPTTPPIDDDDDNDDSAADDDDDTGDDDTGDDDTGDDDTGDDDTGTGDPVLSTDPAQMDFGTFCVGETPFMPLRLINDGGSTLIISGMNSTIPPMTLDEFIGEIEPGDNAIVGVNAACAQPNSFNGEIHIMSNDPTSPDTAVPVFYVCQNC